MLDIRATPGPHVAELPCSCFYCQLIDIVFDDPLLNPWERRFIFHLSGWGWERDYTEKQKAKLVEVHARLRALRLGPPGHPGR